MEVFDLTKDLGQIKPAFAFDSLFAAVGLGMLAAGIAIVRSIKRGDGDLSDRWRRFGWFLIPFALIWIPFTSWMSFQDIQHAYAVRRDVSQGRYSTLEGCLEFFRPGDAKATKSAESEMWRIAGREFSYTAGEIRLGYHTVEANGGIVHANSRVKVSFIRDEYWGRNDIIRLETKPDECPTAPSKP